MGVEGEGVVETGGVGKTKLFNLTFSTISTGVFPVGEIDFMQ